jgi:hypothetical protein
VLIGAASLPAQDGRLDEVRREVRAPSPDRDKPNKDDPDKDSGWANLFADLLCGAFCASAQDKKENEGAFLPYPYFADFPGFLWKQRRDEQEALIPPPPDVTLWQYSGRLLIENANNFTDLNRLGGQLFLDTKLGLGLRADYNWFHERCCCGKYDDMGLGDVNLLYRLVESERFQMHLGLGCVFLSDSRRTDAGPSATASFDVFPIQPVVLSAQFDAGAIGWAGYGHARGTVGYQWKCWELFGGYDWVRIGSVNLQGPLVGIRLWF